MTELDEIRQQLAESQAEALQLRCERDDLQRKLSALRERHDQFERDWQLIGYEIHDGLVQEMTAAIMFLEAVQGEVSFKSDDGQENFARARRLLREAVAEARRLIGVLTEPQSEEQGLLANLQALIARFHRDRGLEVELVAAVGEPALAPAARLAVLRIVREALSNVWRHSKSHRAEVALGQENGQLVVTIRDWGIGFDPAQVPAGHFGLAGMAERVRTLGGDVEIASAPGEGTVVTVRLPLIASAAANPLP